MRVTRDLQQSNEVTKGSKAKWPAMRLKAGERQTVRFVRSEARVASVALLKGQDFRF